MKIRQTWFLVNDQRDAQILFYVFISIYNSTFFEHIALIIRRDKSVFISHISCTSIVRETWEASSLNASIIFQGVTANLYVERSSAVHYPFRLYLMSCPICTVTAQNSSMPHFVISGRGKMRIVLSLASPSTVSNTGLFVPPLNGCNTCVI